MEVACLRILISELLLFEQIGSNTGILSPQTTVFVRCRPSNIILSFSRLSSLSIVLYAKDIPMSPKPKAGTLGPFLPSLRRGTDVVDILENV